MRRSVADETRLACAVGVGAVETPLINGTLREQDQSPSERLPERRKRAFAAYSFTYTFQVSTLVQNKSLIC